VRLLIVALIALATGCGGGSVGDPPSDETEGPAPMAGRPSEPAPKLDSSLAGGPPPAWLETPAGSFWLGYSSYCWGSECADFIAPSCDDPKHTPKVTVRRGDTVTAHLGFEPTELALTFLDGTSRSSRERQKLEPTPTPSWQLEQDGAFSLFARAEGRDASYVACIAFE